MYKYRDLDMQSLIDLLARETKKYTEACVARVPAVIAYQQPIVDALVREISKREAKNKQISKKRKTL